MNPITNILTVDVEDYHDQLPLDFQDRIVPPNQEAERATEQVLELFAEQGVRGTFFILGEIAEHFPGLIRRIADQGHHLGIHGYYHHHAYRLTPEQFRESIGRAKKFVEDIAGREADAHRAVAFSINEKSGTMWALDVIAELGFRYDSSIFPFQGRRYGSPEAPRFPYRLQLAGERTLWEIPMSTVQVGGRRLPACGGGYLRMFPLRYTDFAIRRINDEGHPAVVYIHPYEVVPSPGIEPLAGLSFKQELHFRFFNFQQVCFRRRTVPKLRALLGRYRWGTIADAVVEMEAAEAAQPGRSSEDAVRI